MTMDRAPLAPKGRNTIAQGNALGRESNTMSVALKGRDSRPAVPECRPFRASAIIPGRFPRALPWAVIFRPFGAAILFLTVALTAFAQPPAKNPTAASSPRRVGNGEPSLSPEQSLARKQETQQRVRVMARDLVSAILDIQLQQLNENDLTATDLYRDIQAMRGHIDELIEAEMPRVVKLLAEIEAAGNQRDKTFVAARQKSREILVRLLVERQRVLRRLRIAELAAQVRQLIQAETKIQGITQSLPEQPPTQRESLALATIEDQRDVKAVYLRLHETVKEVATWGGEVGVLASTALQMLQKAQVDSEMENAARSLEQTKFTDAATSEENVLKALRELLRILERVQGVLKGERQSMEQAIQEMIDRQSEIREATNQADANQRDLQQLVQQQSQVQKDLEALSRQAQPAQPLEEASQAAEEATAKLFEGNPKEAVAQQDKVLENLAKAAQSAPEPANADNKPQSPEQSTQAIADLEAARRDLQKILEEQKQASATAVNQPAQARPQEEKIARELAEVPNNRKLPEEVTARTAEAQQVAAEAATRMDAPQPQRSQSTRAAEQAIQRALSEAERALADAKRQQLRDAMNALAKAAQDIQKAAAMEREVAHEAQQGAQKSGLQVSQSHELGQKQAEVKQTAEDVTKRVERAAPEAAKTLAAAQQPIRQAAERLQAAEQQPGEASKPAAKEAANQAQQAAGYLSQAAQQLQREAAQAAQRLAQLTDQQLQQAQHALQSVEQAIANRPEPLAERIEKLAKAEEHVRKAQAEQERASGRPEAARAAELAAQMEKAPDNPSRKALEDALKQAKAEAAKAAETPAGKPDPQAQARVGQEAQAAKELAQPDAAKAAETLAEARKSSDEAQQQMAPSGDPQQASKAQQATAQDLRQAAQQLAEAKKQLAQQAAKELAAQSQSARGLEDQATPVDPGATGALQSAENQAGQATQQLPQSPSVVPPAEQGVAEAMDRAAADLAARVQELSGDQALAQAMAAQAGSAMPSQPSDESLPRPADGGSARKGELARNPPPSARPLQTPEPVPNRDNRGTLTPNADAEAARQRETEEPWFAQLPPEIRAAIRANSQRRPPRGYEERLQRYFKNLD